MRRALFTAAVLVASALPAMAQDAVTVDPKHYKVELENDQVRVLRITYGAHEKSVMHEHPASVAVFLTDGNVRFTLPDGKTEDALAKVGAIAWNAGGKHLPENMGDVRFEVILVELKGTTVLAQGTGTGPDETAAMAAVQQFVGAFNKGDTKTAAAACADQTSIIDEFPPHEWHGQGGCAKWMNDYDADAKKNGITDGLVTLGLPKHIDITADRAYVVVPADYTYNRNGEAVKEADSILTAALQKAADGWRITGWSWTKN